MEPVLHVEAAPASPGEERLAPARETPITRDRRSPAAIPTNIQVRRSMLTPFPPPPPVLLNHQKNGRATSGRAVSLQKPPVQTNSQNLRFPPRGHTPLACRFGQLIQTPLSPRPNRQHKTSEYCNLRMPKCNIAYKIGKVKSAGWSEPPFSVQENAVSD